MTTGGKKRTDDELVRDLEDSMAADMLDLDTPMEAVRAELKRGGLDPASVAARTQELVASLSKQRRLAWKTQAATNRQSMLARIQRRADDIIRQGRARIEQEIEALRNNPLTQQQVVLAFRKRDPRTSSEEELAELLRELYALTDIAAEDDDSK
jgi:hypothetical protein